MPLTYEDLVALWGEDNVVRVPSAELDGLELPAGARRVLVEVGLPRTADRFFAYERPEQIVAADGGRLFCKVGKDYANDLCVAADSGEFLSLSPTGRYVNNFVNSDLERFVEFLCRVIAERRSYAGLSDAESGAIVERMETELRAWDPEAFAGPEYWWSQIFEQLRDGLL